MLVPVAGVVRASTGEQREAVRTRIVLLRAEERPTSSIAATLGVVPHMVSTGREGESARQATFRSLAEFVAKAAGHRRALSGPA